jgi:hypothetical protein
MMPMRFPLPGDHDFVGGEHVRLPDGSECIVEILAEGRVVLFNFIEGSPPQTKGEYDVTTYRLGAGGEIMRCLAQNTVERFVGFEEPTDWTLADLVTIDDATLRERETPR